MKALTISQPYASLLAVGAKIIETRSWDTSYRGPVALHAGKSRRGLAELCSTEHFAHALTDAGLDPGGLPLGAVVAVADLVACEPMTGASIGAQTTRERAFGFWTTGNFAWHLQRVRPITPPITGVRGALSLWSPSDQLHAAIHERLLTSRMRRAYAEAPGYDDGSIARDGTW